MDKKKGTKKTSVLAVIGVILASLLVCLGVVLIIRAINVGKKATVVTVEAGDEKGDQYGGEQAASDNDSVLTELEEVRVYLEELESAVNDSTLSINTLTQNKEGDNSVTDPIIEKLTELSSKVEKTKQEITLMMDGLSSSEMTDLNTILGGFVKITQEIDGIKNALGSMNSLLEGELENIARELENKFDITAANIKNQIETRTNSLKDYSDRFSTIEAMLEQVFQSVSNGKKMLAAAITDKKVEVPSDSAAFEVYCELIRKIGTAGGTVDTGKILEGTTVYDGVNNEYVSGSMPDCGYQENFCPDYSDQKYYEAGYYPNGWMVDTNPAYQKGYIDGKAEIYNANVTYKYHEHTTADGVVHEAGYQSPESGGCFTEPHTYVSGSTMQYGRCPGAYVVDPNLIDVGNGVMQRYAACTHCNIVGGYGGQCTNMIEYPQYTYDIDYYVCNCGKTDYQTAGENASITGAEITFE